MEWIAIGVLGVGLIYLLWRYAMLQRQVEDRARDLYEAWRADEAERETRERADLLFREWQSDAEKEIREDAIKKSQAVIRGKATEHLLPYLPEFDYNPQDARFLGTPVDLVVFDGLSEGHLRQVVFVEVKSGQRAALSPRERWVQHCITRRRVRYEILHLAPDE
jgi:predicted Holliday junction resolvase-like endonuclease